MKATAKYRDRLPQRSQQVFLTDGGMETTLIYHDGIDLPHFASITLHDSEDGNRRLRDYFLRHIAIAKARKAGGSTTPTSGEGDKAVLIASRLSTGFSCSNCMA